MRVLVVGIGDAFTSRHFGCSCVVEAPEGLVLVDCPDSPHRALEEACRTSGWEVRAADIRHIIITHLHGDHVNGLESVGFLQWLARMRHPAPRPRLYMGAEAGARVWERLAPAMDQGGRATLADYFELHVLRPDVPSRIAGLEVESRLTGHPVPTTALRFSGGGRRFGWSSDTPWDPSLVDWLSGCHLVVHETSPAPAHTPVEHLNRLPDELRRRMRLMHVPDDFDPASSDIPVLRQGEVLTV
ncbi:MAG: MBL fold metallo-hydrolase [Phycisphaerales bacterium]